LTVIAGSGATEWNTEGSDDDGAGTEQVTEVISRGAAWSIWG